MKLTIQSPGFVPSQELIRFVNDKISKLAGLYGKIIGSEVCLKLENSAAGENKTCRIRLFIPGNDLLASAQCRKFEAAIAQVVKTLKSKIRKCKTKIPGGKRNYPQ